MAIHPDFPKDPYAILDPEIRWYPADDPLHDISMEKLLPPLVVRLRREVKDFRDRGYSGATDTSRRLLEWWFCEKHLAEHSPGELREFRYFFAQREALETIVYLYDVINVSSKHDFLRFNSSDSVNADMFDENWLRMVIKMATAAGKTKVMSLALAWSYFHKIYEPDSNLATNFLIIAPNIIVLDRIYRDFKELKIFSDDPVIPRNGFGGRYWKDDFQLKLYKQDDVHPTRPVGNIFLTNIQRVYTGKELPASAEDVDTRDYFLGRKPSGATTDSKVDLGVIVRDVDELMIINDEAHHIHDSRLAWFQSIQDIHNHLFQKRSLLSLQLDLTATPRHSNGAIFVQTVTDYPLVEAIHQNVTKHPVLPDKTSREKLQEKPTKNYVEKYSDYLNLGVIEWLKTYKTHVKLGKKAILFVMTDETRNCDDVAEYLNSMPELAGSVLTIHTKNNGDIDEGSHGKKKKELEDLRRLSNDIDLEDSPFKAIVSVLMLKEGWDVRNVTTIVGLRAFTSKSNILPEQTLGRGLRKMYKGLEEEYVSVIGTEAFMEFIESIQAEGVELERKAMGEGTEDKIPLLVEVDLENKAKKLDDLDIEIPVLGPSLYRDYKYISDLDISSLGHVKIKFKTFAENELKQIVFKELTTGEISHVTELDSAVIADYTGVVGWFTEQIMDEFNYFSDYNLLYPKVESFIRDELFTSHVNLEDPNTIRNLLEPQIREIVISVFKQAINILTIKPKIVAEIKKYIKLRHTKTFIVNDQKSILPRKSIFNRIVGDSNLELEFASVLDTCPDVISFAKNYRTIDFKLDYVNTDEDISHYYPDFFVKLSKKWIYIVETKGYDDKNIELKMARLGHWCDDVNKLQKEFRWDFIFVDQETFEKYEFKSFKKIIEFFPKFKKQKI
ncbi:MAG: DEAD/DEAH box helicase family protein [Deltaproteobacteria bacterium]|nr:DEAD/DEAH box helicase family protein [Deltaproteobacteria bacterium]